MTPDSRGYNVRRVDELEQVVTLTDSFTMLRTRSAEFHAEFVALIDKYAI